MQEKQLSPFNNTRVFRVYLTIDKVLDKPFNLCIMDYKWSSSESEWIMEKMIWNTWSDTQISNSLRDGKYLLTLI